MASNTILILIVLCTTGFSVAIGLRYVAWWRAAFLWNIFAIIALACLPISVALIRLLGLSFILVGILWIQYRQRRRSLVKKTLVRCLKSLGSLCQFVHTTHRVYAIKQHKRHAVFLQALADLREQAVDTQYQDCVAVFESLYALILSLNALFYRVSDLSTFEVAQVELNTTATCLITGFQALAVYVRRGESFPGMSDTLGECIRQLEEVYHSALQVVASEPLVFLVFLHDLSALNETFLRLSIVLESAHRAAGK